MNSSYALDSYRAHDLNVTMKTSSGDVIKMDFSNHQSTSLSSERNANGSRTSMSFSSTQSFQFSIKSNGIDEQDQKEIDEFMKIAQPFIDDFIQELEDFAPKTPVTQLAKQIASIFEPSTERDENAKNRVKTNIVKAFDDAIERFETRGGVNSTEALERIYEETKKLLEKTLKAFDEFNKELYA